MELFDLYDNLGNKLHRTMERGTPNNEGEYHLVAHIWIRNSEGKYLIQQRNKLSDRIPHQWACTGGAVTSGEHSMQGAIRETYEEIGVLFQPEQLKLVKRFFVDDDFTNYITDLYLIEADVLIKDLKLDTVEVKQCAYYTLDEIQQLIKDKKHWNYERFATRQGYFKALEDN